MRLVNSMLIGCGLRQHTKLIVAGKVRLYIHTYIYTYTYIHTYLYTPLRARLSCDDELCVLSQSASDEHRVDEAYISISICI